MKVLDLYGLILVGGQSSRMGKDKSSIKYHGRPQLEHLHEIMNGCLEQTFISVRPGQSTDQHMNLIEDIYDIRGPLNGLLSAHKTFPTKAWLVVAVDLPFVTESTIEKLIGERDDSLMATAYIGSKDGLPEPLAAIWEPRALDSLNTSLMNSTPVFPRKFLIDNPIKSIKGANAQELFNVNTEIDFENAKSLIKKG